MIFSIQQQIAYLSQGTTLEAGSIILTGGSILSLCLMCHINNPYQSYFPMAYVTRSLTKMPGTPAGIGCLHRPPKALRHGDVFCVHIEKIGTLINTVRYE